MSYNENLHDLTSTTVQLSFIFDCMPKIILNGHGRQKGKGFL